MVEDVELLDKQFDPTTTLYFQQKVNNFCFLSQNFLYIAIVSKTVFALP